MRIRTIKPDFWQNEKLSEVSETAHMLAAALINYCDDEGYFNANPRLIKAALFPLRDTSVSIHGALSELSLIGYIRLGSGSDGREYGHIVNFLSHQKINRPTPSKISGLAEFNEDSVSPHGALTVGKERKGKEMEVEESAGGQRRKKKKNKNNQAEPCETSIKYVRIFNEVFCRKIKAIGTTDKRIKELLAEGYDDWKLLVMPIIQCAIQPDVGETRNFDTLMLIRTGEHGRTGENGATYGKTDWIQRAHGNADKHYADARLSAIAYKYGLADIVGWLMKGMVKDENNTVPQIAIPGMKSSESKQVQLEVVNEE